MSQNLHDVGFVIGFDVFLPATRYFLQEFCIDFKNH